MARAVRSFLSVPATGSGMAEKGLATGADGVFLDLEDAVAPARKEEARAGVVRALSELDWGGRKRIFRMNAVGTPYFYGDVIEVVEGAGEALEAILVPKVRRAGDLYAVDALLSAVEAGAGLPVGRIELEAQIEDAEGLEEVGRISRASRRLTALHFGPGDFAASVGAPQAAIGVRDEWDEAYPGHRFSYAMQRLVVSARAAGLRVYDGPSADYRDREALERSCRLARALGYDGKWCIHPKQVEVVNRVFTPTEREVERAREIVRAYREASESGSGAIVVGGEMVDAASVQMARRTLLGAGEEGEV
ncbi:Citrate lyase beta subunit [Rubrobacter radiotolerans]|uniref:Citrate lyase beta subunit n=1 Tax=Rubrobacter radiotolerans TaxID=42256 RepID=A0A023X6B2_RUBRA|nr:CoA ester lyase [Rubrobacter radiotolerans]AHY47535.1 Citrate lyase beta subunit [Rubrobacter radiotolerans]MDX5894938.1 CoA ester lyase [Rubrobacter radiotolerans]SMC07114.1 citrate lyase subunit beta / citryl-CoA lyase [Rubrobacter radiotolerans DSM 5868]